MKNKSAKILIWAVSVLCGGLAIITVALGQDAPSGTGVSRGPYPKGTKNLVKHMAYEMDEADCSSCHKNADPANPGGLLLPVNEGCFECHDNFPKKLAQPFAHAPALDRCTACHNPHESLEPALLVEEVEQLCLGCHDDVATAMAKASVKHGAVETGKKCLNCHNPHSSTVEKLLLKPAMDECLDCHNKDDLKDHAGRPLTNMKQLLADNPRQHSPVAGGECTTCHNPHSSGNYRLLKQEYPASFYSPFEVKNYALCFECHEEGLITDAETTTQTKFRDGRRNLHYVHVNKAERGRTCRACHEVHASKEKALLRDGAPYGPKNWMLRTNFTKTDTGGTCTKTCHTTKSYDNSAAASGVKRK